MKLASYQPNVRLGKGGYGNVYQNCDSNYVSKVHTHFRHGIQELTILNELKSNDCQLVDDCQLLVHSFIYYWDGDFYLCDNDNKITQIESPESCLKNNARKLVINLPKYSSSLAACKLQSYLYNADYDFSLINYRILLSYYQLYQQFIVHGDIKLENILIQTQSQKIAICDFNLAFRQIVPKLGEYLPEDTNYFQTIDYRAPELIFGDPLFSQMIDIWSLGMVFLKLATQTNFFSSANKREQMVNRYCRFFGLTAVKKYLTKYNLPNDNIPKRNYRPQKTLILADVKDSDLRDLISKILVLDPDDRLTLPQIFAHPYFKTRVTETNFSFKIRSPVHYLDEMFQKYRVDNKLINNDQFDRLSNFLNLANFFFELNLPFTILANAIHLFDYLVSQEKIEQQFVNLVCLIRILGSRHFCSDSIKNLQIFLDDSQLDYYNDQYFCFQTNFHQYLEILSPLEYYYLSATSPLPNLRESSPVWIEYLERVSSPDFSCNIGSAFPPCCMNSERAL